MTPGVRWWPVLIVLAACTALPAVETVTLGDGTVVELEPAAEVEREEAAGRIALRSGDGLVVTLQELAVDERGVESRTVAVVAAAIAERVKLRERNGELVQSSCEVGGRPAECLDGWQERDGTRFARSGAVVQLGTRIVWLDVAGPQTRGAAVIERSRTVRASLRVRGS